MTETSSSGIISLKNIIKSSLLNFVIDLIEPPIANLREAVLSLSADELMSLIEQHSAKLELISKLANRYVKMTVMDTVI